MGGLRAGVARTVITPPVGIPLVGFAGRGPSIGVYQDLTATALALESGGSRAVVVAADLLYLNGGLQAEVRAEVARRCGVAEGSVLLCASHTHYGPPGEAGEDAAPEIGPYLANLRYLVAGVAQAALAERVPVRLGFGIGASDIGINRRERRPGGQIVLGRNPEGARDREVRVVRLDTMDGRPLALLVNFACHPVSGTHALRLISPDYIGPMRRLVEGATGAACLFLQGAAGNINAAQMEHSTEPARRLGTMLGAEVVRVFEDTPTAEVGGLAAAGEAVGLPAMSFPSREAGESAVEGLRAELERARREGANGGALWWVEHRLSRAERMLESLRSGTPLPVVPAELFALRLGDVALATAPGEIFTEIGMEVKRRSPLPRTCFVGYTNGSVGYVPIPEAYGEGGYEVTHASRVGPGAAGLITETLLTLLERVAAA